jgi:hypothetical protein
MTRREFLRLAANAAVPILLVHGVIGQYAALLRR